MNNFLMFFVWIIIFRCKVVKLVNYIFFLNVARRVGIREYDSSDYGMVMFFYKFLGCF